MPAQVNFTSTYRIEISQPGINNAKKSKLKQLISSYPNGLIGNSKKGYARISIPNQLDAEFIRKLKGIGYKEYQKFDADNIPTNEIDSFIKDKLYNREYQQYGKNIKRMSTEQKLKAHYNRTLNKTNNTEISEENIEDENDQYLECVKKYGKEVADTIFDKE